MEETHDEQPELEEEEDYLFFPGSLIESRVGQLDDMLLEKLEEALHQNTSQVRFHEIAKIASEHDPVDLAYAAYKLPHMARPVLFENLPDQAAQIKFLIAADRSTRIVSLRQATDEQIKDFVHDMPPDEAVSLLDDLSKRRCRKVLELLSPTKARHIRELLSHETNTVGRMMTNEFFAFPMHITLSEVAVFIRNNPGIDFTRRIFVVGRNHQLQGYVPIRNLVVNPPNTPLKKVMRPILHKVLPDATREEAVDLVERYKISALPVVDKDDKIVGIVTYEDIIEAMEDITDETVARFAGTGEDISEHQPILRRFGFRAPWLIVTIAAGFISETQMAFFSNRVLAFTLNFVPLITGISGNVGIQCSTVLVRAIATGEVSQRTKNEFVLKEFTLGAIAAVTFGLLTGFVVYALNALGIHHIAFSPFYVGIMMGTGVMGACLMATFLGSFSPLLFARFRIDPAVASGPIVTAFNDVLSALIYFLIVGKLGAYLIEAG